MPLYEFECEKCHHRFEKIQSVSAPDPECPKCGSKVERLLHAPAVQFKGSGWYVTDYAKSGSKADSKSGDKAASSSSESKSESKTESKPETKSKPSKE
ncbi:MAG TPA: FmdB family zinc ribbon protein [Terriglobales bacterium]|nr:FmdB family zinc ribbon protein [Terriglobales bacterium]